LETSEADGALIPAARRVARSRALHLQRGSWKWIGITAGISGDARRQPRRILFEGDGREATNGAEHIHIVLSKDAAKLDAARIALCLGASLAQRAELLPAAGS
tara:strand:- start:335 stop:643 length:309 start_codon:yes stop_codon:yes gene_type:complete